MGMVCLRRWQGNAAVPLGPGKPLLLRPGEPLLLRPRRCCSDSPCVAVRRQWAGAVAERGPA